MKVNIICPDHLIEVNQAIENDQYTTQAIGGDVKGLFIEDQKIDQAKYHKNQAYR